jgi:hypothetical protein
MLVNSIGGFMGEKVKRVKRKATESLGVITKLLARSIEQRAAAIDAVDFTQEQIAIVARAEKPSKSVVKKLNAALVVANSALAYYEANVKELQKRQASAMKAIEKAQSKA